MKNRGFTVLQLVFSVVIILIISSVAVVGYRKIVEMSRENVCATNQKALTNAVQAYITTNYVFPTVLGDLKREHLEKGYAQVMEEAGWFTKFSHFVVKTSMSSEAYAQFLTYENLKGYGVSKDFFRCPSDPNGGVSYGINANVAGKYWHAISNNVIIVGDCDSHTFSGQGQLRKRHGSGHVAIAVTKAQTVAKFQDGSFTSDAEGNPPAFDDDGNDHDIDSDSFDRVETDLQSISDANTGVLQARMEDVMTKVQAAKAKVEAGEMSGAASELEAAIGVVQTTVDEGLLGADQGEQIINELDSKLDIINNLAN